MQEAAPERVGALRGVLLRGAGHREDGDGQGGYRQERIDADHDDDVEKKGEEEEVEEES